MPHRRTAAPVFIVGTATKGSPFARARAKKRAAGGGSSAATEAAGSTR